MARPAPRPSRPARSSSPLWQRRRKHEAGPLFSSQESVRPPLRSQESLRKMAKAQDAASVPARSALSLRSAFKWESPKSRSHRRHRHVRFASNEKSYSKSSSQECLESALWPVALPHSYGSNAARSAKHRDVERDTHTPESETQERAKTKSKSEATANIEVKTSKAEISMEKIEERSDKKEKEERKRRLKMRMRSRYKRRINDEGSSNEKMEAKPRVAVKLYDGRDSWPLEISKWHLSDHGQLLLSCLLPTQNKRPEAERRREPSETVIPKKIQSDCHRKENRKHGDQDIVTLFERSAISRSVFQTQPYFRPRHTNSETLIWSPMPTPTFTPTPARTPLFSPPITPTTPETFSTPPASPKYLNICLMPTKAEILPTIELQSFSPRTASQKEMFTQTSPLTSTLQMPSCVSGCANATNTRELFPSMAPATITQSTSSGEWAITSPDIDPTTTPNSLHSRSLTQTMMEIDMPFTMIPDVSSTSQRMPMMSVTMTPIVKRTPDTTSGRSTSATNMISSPLLKKTNPMADNASNIKPNQLIDTLPSFTHRCTKPMHGPKMITTMSSAVQCVSSPAPTHNNAYVSSALTITPVPPPASVPVSATWAPSSVTPSDCNPSFAIASTDTQTPIFQAMQIPFTAPMEFPADPSCMSSLTCGPHCLNKDSKQLAIYYSLTRSGERDKNPNQDGEADTAGALTAAGASVAAYDTNSHLIGNHPYKHPPVEAVRNVSEMHHATLPQKNTPNNMSRLDIAQQILKRLTVDIQAQHARICDSTYKSCHLSENSQQPIDAVSHVPEELEETNTQLGSVSLIIQKNQGIVNPLAASSNTQESPEISLESSQPASTVTWKFWHPQSSSWFSLSLPDKNAHEMLQSAEPVKRNFENLLQSALNVRNPSINADPKLTEKGVFSNSMSLAPEIPNEQGKHINEQLRNEPADVELRFEDPQDRVTTFLNKGNDTTLSSEEIPATNVQYPERTNVPQIQSSEGKPPPQSPVDKSQTCSAIPVEKPSNDHRDPNIKIEEGTSPEDNALLNMHLTSSVVWRLWEPNSGSWVSLNISKGNPEQVIECQQVNIQDANLETETGKSTEDPKENSTPNSIINENTVIPKGENVSSTTQTQKLEASLMILNHFSKTETQTALLDNGIDSENKELYLSNFVIKPLTPNLQSGQQSPVLTNDIWSDSPTSHLESTDAETWGVWPTSSLESLSVRKTRSIKCSSSHRRRQKSSNADTPRKNIAGTTRLRGSQSNTTADATDERNLLRYPSGPKTSLRSELAIKRWLQRRQVPSSGTKTFLRSELAIKRCLQRRQVPSMNARSNHRLKFERWRRQRSLVNTDYHRQYHHMRRSSVSPHENFTARSAEEANLNSVETPSLLLLCLTASSLLPRARYQRSNKKQYCIIQNPTTKKFGNPEQVPWKRASRQWRKNLATDK